MKQTKESVKSHLRAAVREVIENTRFNRVSDELLDQLDAAYLKFLPHYRNVLPQSLRDSGAWQGGYSMAFNSAIQQACTMDKRGRWPNREQAQIKNTLSRLRNQRAIRAARANGGHENAHRTTEQTVYLAEMEATITQVMVAEARVAEEEGCDLTPVDLAPALRDAREEWAKDNPSLPQNVVRNLFRAALQQVMIKARFAPAARTAVLIQIRPENPNNQNQFQQAGRTAAELLFSLALTAATFITIYLFFTLPIK